MTAPQRFRSRPQTVEAVRWLGEENCAEVFAFLGWKHEGHCADVDSHYIELANTGEWAQVGDWIVQHEPGRFEVMSDAEFQAAYDPEMTEWQAVLLDAIRRDGGDWLPVRAAGVLMAAGFNVTPQRAHQIMKQLADLGYLKQVRPRSYTYRLKTAGEVS